MKLEAFSSLVKLASKPELEKVVLLAYFFHKVEAKPEFTRRDISSWFTRLHFGAPNLSRLEKKIRDSRKFVRGGSAGSFKLHAVELDLLQQELPGLRAESDEIISDDTILPKPVYEGARGFVESLAKQVNASYEYNIFDGCAVLMRRLLEVLLILSYEHLNIDSEIQDGNGNYYLLEKVISNAKTNRTLKLSRDSKALVDEFRLIGNFSAHKIYYNCRRADLKRITRQYRATVEELLYKCGIRT